MSVISLGKANVTLRDWNILIITTADGLREELFIGYSIGDGLGRLSTKIEHYDPETQTGATHSGSTYNLIGQPGMPHDDAMYVLESFLSPEIVNLELFSDHSTGALRFKYAVIKKK